MLIALFSSKILLVIHVGKSENFMMTAYLVEPTDYNVTIKKVILTYKKLKLKTCHMYLHIYRADYLLHN